MIKLANLNYSLIGFGLFAIRMLALGATIPDAIVMATLTALYGFDRYLVQKQIKAYNEKFEQDVKVEFLKAADEISKLKGVLGAINLGATYNSSLKKMAPNGRE